MHLDHENELSRVAEQPRLRGLAVLATCLLAFSASCGSDSDSTAKDSVPANTGEAVVNYAAIVHASYEDSLEAAKDMDATIQAFVEDPSQESLDAARQAWRDAREPYLQTEVYRFYDGPIDNPDDGPEGLINAWPLDEAYIDYVEDDADAGIVNDPELDIDAASLMELNEVGGEENIATGYHAVEFLLWGQDLSQDGPGARPLSDYLEEGGAPNAERRALYLQTVSELLVEHLEGLGEAWADSGDNYREQFESAAPSEGLRRILTGMINLSGFETGGERLQAALDSGSQEDEHSCFSDNTHRDMIQDIQGILNVWLGSYTRLDGSEVAGTSIKDVLTQVDAQLAGELDGQIKASLELAKDLEVPFDQEIAPDNDEGNARVRALVESLNDVDHTLEQFFELLKLEVQAAG